MGKLKIYFGAAPGVGKTYSMLQDACAKLKQGLDVIVGVAESHGRKEIDGLLNYFEITPRRTVIYRDKELVEFDLDAALKRNLALILIDEMAHTNVPGLRHSKRWQDIKEILDRGIDVYTTLNVQHVESINDDVTQIIGIKIRETIPDSMLEIAETIELVDLPAEDLLKRLQDGKVYFPAMAELAVENFFRRDKLTALRELALRITAERVGAQVLLFRKGEGIETIWPSQEKVMVCIGSDSGSLKLIRTAKRIAKNTHMEWIALHVEVPKLRISKEARNSAIKNLRFAERLGAETRIISVLDIVKEIMHVAREQNVTQIIVGKKIRSRWRTFFLKDLADEIVRHSAEIDVYVVTELADAMPTQIKKDTNPFSWKLYLATLVITGAATAFNVLLSPAIANSNIMMVFLLAITTVALFGRIGLSILASVLSVVAYGFFFISPTYQFMASDLQYFFTLLVMLLVAFVISNLAILTRRQAESSYFTEHQTSILHKLSRKLSSTRGVDKILETGVQYIGEIFHCEVLALRPHNFELSIRARYKTDQLLSEKELGVAKWVFELGQKAGLGTDTLAFSDALYLPLLATKEAIAVLRIKPEKADVLFSPEEMRLLESCAHQLALTMEADRIADRDRKSELKAAINRERSQLLQDISHDLHIPLISAMGSLNTVLEEPIKISTKEKKYLCESSYIQLEKLSRLINNFLQITYLEGHEIKIEKKEVVILDLINSAMASLKNTLHERTIIIMLSDDAMKIFVDRNMLIEVIKNLLENAVKFTPSHTSITVSASQEKERIIVCIKDEGPGIIQNEKEKLFEKFYRGSKVTAEHGVGLGLAISQKIIQAHGGEMWAENIVGSGAAFYFSLPC